MSRQILVEILGDASKFNRATKDATTSASKFGNVFQGIGQGLGIGLWTSAGTAISSVTDYLRDSVAAAREEEVGIARLSASLAANVAGWDGNTEAIERRIKASLNTGFSDDAMRESLARLVPVTKNVTEAFDLQRTAMDLARFKGISLADASVALVKVEGGQYRALKELGIVLKEGATQTEALAEVQRVAGGQMAAYMDTSAGKAEVLKNRMDDLQEEIGAHLIPIVDDATVTVLKFMDALDTDAPIETQDRLSMLGDVAGTIASAFSGSGLVLRDYQERLLEVGHRAPETSDALEDMREAARSNATGIRTWAADVKVSAGNAATDIILATRRAQAAFDKYTAYLLGEYNTSFDKAMSIQEARLTLHNSKEDKEKAEAYATLAELGALSKKDYANWMATLERLAKGTKGEVRAAYEDAMAKVRALRALASKPIPINVVYTITTGRYAGKSIPGNASGGSASGLTWVGEKGPELIDAPAGSYVHTASRSRQMTSGNGGSGITVNVAGSIIGPSGIDELTDMMAARLRFDGV